MNEQMLRFDDALRAYDEAIGIERSTQGYWAVWSKAAFLAKLGRTRASLAIFEALLIRSDLGQEDREKIAQNVETLRRDVSQAR